MRIAIVGPGAIGGLFGAVLSRGGLDVTLVSRRAEEAERIGREGVRIEGRGGDYVSRPNAVCLESPASALRPFDVILVAVKAYDTESAARTLAPIVGPETTVVTVQNGLGNVEILVTAFGRGRVLGGATNQGANVLRTVGAAPCGRPDGEAEKARAATWGRPDLVIDHAYVAGTTIGELDGRVTERAKRIAETFTAAGLETAASDNIDGVIWTKLLINVGINPLVALLRVRNGVLAEHAETLDLMRLAVTEGLEVAKAKGVRLLVPDPVGRAVDQAVKSGGNIASMLQDVRAGRRTEIDFITGAIVREGRRLGIPTPVNEALTLLVRAVTVAAASRLNSEKIAKA